MAEAKRLGRYVQLLHGADAWFTVFRVESKAQCGEVGSSNNVG